MSSQQTGRRQEQEQEQEHFASATWETARTFVTADICLGQRKEEEDHSTTTNSIPDAAGSRTSNMSIGRVSDGHSIDGHMSFQDGRCGDAVGGWHPCRLGNDKFLGGSGGGSSGGGSSSAITPVIKSERAELGGEEGYQCLYPHTGGWTGGARLIPMEDILDDGFPPAPLSSMLAYQREIIFKSIVVKNLPLRHRPSLRPIVSVDNKSDYATRMSLLFQPSFPFPNGGFRKPQEADGIFVCQFRLGNETFMTSAEMMNHDEIQVRQQPPSICMKSYEEDRTCRILIEEDPTRNFWRVCAAYSMGAQRASPGPPYLFPPSGQRAYV